jgi:hypothetical protein
MEPIGIILLIVLLTGFLWALSHLEADPNDPRW